MPEKNIPFVITDRRKFNPDGQPREGSDQPSASAQPSLEPEPVSAQTPAPEPAPTQPLDTDSAANRGAVDEPPYDLPAAPTPEQMEQSQRAFQATAERLDTAIRAANPGGDHPPPLTFESLIQSVYMQAVLQLGGGTQEGAQPQVDLLGARQSLDMLGILAEKTRGNLSNQEDTLLSSALFELRLAFLEVTQALARSAAQRAPGGPGVPPPPAGRSGPRIVR